MQLANAAERQAVTTQPIDRSVVAISGMTGISAAGARLAWIAATEVAQPGERLDTLVGRYRMREMT